MLASVRSLLRRPAAWPVESQQAARRNALVAATALTGLRRERDEVDRVVEAAVRRHAVRSRLSAPATLSAVPTTLPRSADVI
jgi:hypothetical protein